MMHTWWDTTSLPLSFTVTLRGHGRLIVEEDSIELPAITLERSKYSWREPWRVRAVLSDSEARRAFDTTWRWKRARAEISGLTNGGEPFKIDRAGTYALSGRELTLDADVIDIGASELTSQPAEQGLAIGLTPTDLVLRRPTDPTQVKARIFVEEEPFNWTFSRGRMQLEVTDKIERATVNGMDCGVEVPEVAIHGAIEGKSDNPRKLVDDVEEELRPFLSVLSLLSRRRVDWTRLMVSSHDLDATPPVMADYTRWRSTSIADDTSNVLPLRVLPLVNSHLLGRDEIDAMSHRLAGFKGSKHLALGIAFLSGIKEEGFLEAKILSAFTALEAVVSGLPAPQDDEKDQLRELRSLLDAEVDRHSEKYTPEVIGRAHTRIASLSDQPFAKRVGDLAATFDIKWADLFTPSPKAVERGMRAALKHRHALVHRGELLDAQEAYKAALRVRALTERLLFAALGGHADWIHPQADLDVRDL